MQKIWICGSKGQIGRAINDVVNKLEFEILNTDIDDLDVTDTDEVMKFCEMNRPDIIINCTGMTDVGECENNKEMAFKINALGARNLAIGAAKLAAKIIQLSTDDVFDGDSSLPYTEYDETNPKTVYGRSKLAGENYVKEFTYRHFIVRSTWVYGKGNNFIMNFLDKVNKGEKLCIAGDQYGSPTSANELARFIICLAKTGEFGTYHATGKGVCSRYEFANEILRLTKKSADITSVTTKDSDFSKVRPAYAVLDNFVLRMTPVFEFSKWQDSLEKYLTERGLCNNVQ